MNGDAISDESLKDAVTAGAIRCINAHREGMSVLRPVIPDEEFGWDRNATLLLELGEEELQAYYIHLLLRANAFLEFLQGNVGETADYPLRVMGESPHAVDEFYDQLRELEDIVGVLTEI